MIARRIAPAVTAALAALLAGMLTLMLTGSAAAALGAAAIGAAAGALVPPDRPAASRHPVLAHDERSAALGSELHRLLDPLPLGILLIDSDGTILFANRRAGELFGLPQTPDLPVGTLRARRLLDLIEAALEERRSGTCDFRITRGGEAHLHAHVRALADETGGAIVAIEDWTEAERAGELHRDFVANASHELKTPLAAVSGIIETLLGHARDDPDATERFLAMLAVQTGRMTRLVEDLLSLNRIELNERVMPDEPQDLAGIVAEAVETLRPAAEAGAVRLTYSPPDGRPRVFGDRNELGQLFRNLIENAIKYGGEGAEVHVAAVPAPPQHPALIGISVRDTGPGIAREHLPRLTERFYRVSVKRSREKDGTGLGLAIVKHILNRHRGRLEIESRIGKGSCFTAWLPLAAVPPDERAARDMDAPEANTAEPVASGRPAP